MTLKTISAIPGPKGWPLIGTAFKYLAEIDGLSFSKMFEVYSKRANEYGPIFKEKIGPLTNVVVSNVSEYRKVMHGEGKLPNRLPIEPLRCYRSRSHIGEGLTNSNGKEWHRHRTAVSKKMLRIEEVNLFAPAMNVVADDLVKYMAAGLDGRGRYRRSLRDTLFRWALESVGTALLGTRIGALDDHSELGRDFTVNLRGVFDGMQELMFGVPFYKLVPTASWRKFVGHCDRVFALGAEILAASENASSTQRRCRGLRQESSETEVSVLADLMQNSDLSETEVKALVVELMAGSVETVGNTMLWCLYQLSLPDNDRVQARLRDEAVRNLASGAVVSLETSSRMPYVKACIKETLRLHMPLFATSRFIAKDIDVCGYRLQAGTHVQANVYHMNRCPTLFERPEQFEPERWLIEQPLDVDLAAQLVWGHGARMCIGRRLAEQEMYIALSKLAKRFTFLYDGSAKPKPIMRIVLNPDIEPTIRFLENNSTHQY